VILVLNLGEDTVQVVVVDMVVDMARLKVADMEAYTVLLLEDLSLYAVSIFLHIW
jgi:hypothetical protein